MKVKVSVANPVRQSDGRWKLDCKDVFEEIPDLGREEDICNFCGCDLYPECKKECDVYEMKTLDKN